MAENIPSCTEPFNHPKMLPGISSFFFFFFLQRLHSDSNSNAYRDNISYCHGYHCHLQPERINPIIVLQRSINPAF